MSAENPSSPPQVNRAIAATCAAMACFSVNDTMMKLAGSLLPTGETMVIRSIVAVIILLALLRLSGRSPRLQDLRHPIVMLRSALEMGVALFYLSALPHLPLTNAVSIFLTAPLMSTAAAPFVLGEQVGWRRWAAVVIGFAGVLLVVRPGVAGFNSWSLAVVASAACAVARDFASRRLPAPIPSTTATVGTVLWVLLGGLLLAPQESWRLPDLAALLPIGVAVIAVTLGNQCVIVGFRHGAAAIVSPYRYTLIVWGILLGFIVFGEHPDLLAVSGIALIVASGLYTLRRERIRGSSLPQSRATEAA